MHERRRCVLYGKVAIAGGAGLRNLLPTKMMTVRDSGGNVDEPNIARKVKNKSLNKTEGNCLIPSVL